jgi:hypothetical protein
VSDGDADRQVTYATTPTSLTVTRFPGTDARACRVYRYDAEPHSARLPCQGSLPRLRARRCERDVPEHVDVRVANGTGAGASHATDCRMERDMRTGTVASAELRGVAFDHSRRAGVFHGREHLGSHGDATTLTAT